MVEAARTRVSHSWDEALAERRDAIVGGVESRGRSYPAVGHSAEPNLILDQGGLRDLALINALSRSLDPSDTWTAHPTQSIRLRDAGALLRDVRDASQVVRDGGSGRLLASDQAAVAGLTGFTDSSALLTALELAGRTVHWELRRVVRALRSADGDAAPIARVEEATWIPPGVQIELADHSLDIPGTGRVSWIEVLSAVRFAAETGCGLTPGLVARVLDSVPTTSEPLTDLERDMLLGILTSAHLVDTWEALDVHGMVVAWVPGWARVRHRTPVPDGGTVMFDRFVIHSIAVAVTIARSRGSARVDLCAWAALVHWVDSSMLKRVATMLAIDPADIELLEIVIREHVTLAETADSHDLMDPAAISSLADATGSSADVLDAMEILTLAQSQASLVPQSAWRNEKIDFLSRSVRAIIDARHGTAMHDDPVHHALATLRGVNPQVARLALLGTESEYRVGVVVTPPEGPDGHRHLVVAFPEKPQSLLAITAMAARFGIELVSGSFDVRSSTVFSAWWVRPRGDSLPHPSVLREFLSTRMGLAKVKAPRAARRTPPSPEPAHGRLVQAIVKEIDSGADGLRAFQINAEDRLRLVGDVASAVSAYPVEIKRAHLVRLSSRAVVALYVAPTSKARGVDDLAQRLMAALERAAHRH